jgi:hypothetical protein
MSVVGIGELFYCFLFTAGEIRGMSEKHSVSCTLKIALISAVFAGIGCGTDALASETYRLVQAIGNSEKVHAKGLSKAECETKKRELKAVAEAIGTYNEKTGFGSITCLPDSFFKD